MSKICAIIDYGIGNVFSVSNAISHVANDQGIEPILTRDHKVIEAADYVVLPGVGAFGRAVDMLRTHALDQSIYKFLETGRPFIGICVGMQVLMEKGYEFGEHEGLGLIPGAVQKIQSQANTEFRIPIIGWHPLKSPDSHQMDHGNLPFEEDQAFYFVHSYEARPTHAEHLVSVTHHEPNQITAAVQKDNILGVQFHPERSGDTGLAMLKSFLEQ